MKKFPAIFMLLIAFIAGVGGAWFFSVQNKKNFDPMEAKPIVKESTYDRVMRTQTIRCGYVLWTPFMVKEPNTGQLSGIFYDYVEGLGKALHLKIEWTEETTWGDFPAALDNGRFDAMCGGGWPNSGRARVIDIVRPILYQPIYAHARIDDKRFDNNLEAINDPAVTIVTVEGTSPNVIAAQDFPKAQALRLPEATSLPEAFVNVAGGKGDVVITSPVTAHQYEIHNPGKIRRIPAKMPLRVFSTTIFIPGGQDRFRRMLDIATEEMLSSGQIEKIIAKYDVASSALLQVALPYQNTETTR